MGPGNDTVHVGELCLRRDHFGVKRQERIKRWIRTGNVRKQPRNSPGRRKFPRESMKLPSRPKIWWSRLKWDLFAESYTVPRTVYVRSDYRIFVLPCIIWLNNITYAVNCTHSIASSRVRGRFFQFGKIAFRKCYSVGWNQYGFVQELFVSSRVQ